MIVSTPFTFRTNQGIQQVFTNKVVEELEKEGVSRIKHMGISFELEKETLEKRQVYAVARKYIHKNTGQTIMIIEAAEPIDYRVDYGKMPDFSYSIGAKTDTLLGICKERLAQPTNQPLDESYLKYLRPLRFIEDCNLKPPNCDFFQAINKEIPTRRMGLSAQFADEAYPNKPRNPPSQETVKTKLYEKMSEFFSRRPIWVKNVLLNQLKVEGFSPKSNQLKSVIQYFAYLYRDGPWRHAYVRLGYDPKKDRRSVIHQVVTLKLKNKEVGDFDQGAEEQQLYDPTFSQIQKGKAVRSYQLCDIADDRIREIFEDNLVGLPHQCDKETGWLSKAEHKRIYRILKSRLSAQS